MQKATSSAESPEATILLDRNNESCAEISMPDNGMTENASGEANQGDVSYPSPSLPLPSSPPVFPKEFNKNYLESLDRRYLVILFLTLLLEPLLIWYLLRIHPPGMDEREIAKLQNKYAELFLSEFKIEGEASDTQNHNELLLRASELIPQIVDETAGAEAGEQPAIRPSAVSPEVRALPREHREALRRATTLSRQRGMQALSHEVERIGLLGIITSGSGVVSYQPVTDILQFADSTAWDIDQALSEVNVLRVPRAGVDYFGPSIAGATSSTRGAQTGNRSDEIFLVPKEVRGKRANTSGVTPEDIVTGLVEAEQKTVQRNRTFEQVAATPTLTPGVTGLRSRPTNGQTTRDREKIREIVSAHNPAIQDCYRKALKSLPTLKGTITVRFTISPAGYIAGAEVVSSSLTVDSVPIKLAEMEACILNKIVKWRDFGQVDESVGNVTVKQKYAFGY
jgi:hypothetical protein